LIHPTAIVSEKARLGKNISIGAFSVIHDNVILEDNIKIDAYCEIGYPTPLAEGRPLIISDGALIRSHSVFYEGSIFGKNLVTGHRVTVREKVTAGNNFQIGTLGDIQGYCTIGNYVRTHSHVHIGQYSNIGHFVWVFPDVLFTNDANPPSENLQGPHVGNYVVIASKAILLPGVKVGKGAFITAQSLVGQDVPDGTVASGSPAKCVCKTSDLRMKNAPQTRAYPWNKRFHRGYSDAIVSQWRNGIDDVVFENEE
jgi:acetyltransferase-like isoleucine patch superfamily enzyme